MKLLKNLIVSLLCWSLLYVLFLNLFLFLVVDSSTPEVGLCEVGAVIATMIALQGRKEEAK